MSVQAGFSWALDEAASAADILGALNTGFAVMSGLLDRERVEMARAVNGLTAVLHLKKVAARERIFGALDGYFTENRAIEFNLLFKTRKLESTQ